MQVNATELTCGGWPQPRCGSRNHSHLTAQHDGRRGHLASRGTALVVALRAKELLETIVGPRQAEGRTLEFPEVPTLREQGLDVVYSIWSGLFARAGTPPASLDRLEAACERALRSSAVVEGFRRLATPIVFHNQRDFAGFWQDELAKSHGVLQAAGIRAAD